MKRKFETLPLKKKIYVYLLLFLAVMIVLLWLFEIVFLDDFYKAIKISQVRHAAEAISQNIDNESLIALVRRFATENQMCVSIVDEDGITYISADVMPGCVIHNTPSITTSRLYSLAETEGGSYLNTIERSAFRDETYDDSKFFGKVPAKDMGMSTIVLYTKIAPEVNGENYAVIINTNISPITSTVDTLRTQLLWITAIMAVVGLIFSWIISSGISKPITEMTNSAKSLAKGNYEADFVGGSYLETAELADALNYAAEELKKVDTLKSELIANVSHDLRTPLTMIKGYSEMMRDIPGEDNTENLQVIIDETEHLAMLVSDILDLSKLQAGADKLNMANFSLTNCILVIINRYSALTEKDGYKIIFDYDGEVFVNADEVKITQVIYNLINNAINYSGEDKTVIVSQISDGKTVRIEVTDHGPGIPQEKLRDIWDRYYKVSASNAHKRSVIGTGLGLSIVKTVLKLHSAAFGVRSIEGKGSTFYFELNIDK